MPPKKKKPQTRSITKRVTGLKASKLLNTSDFRIILNGTPILLTEALDKVYPIYHTFDKEEKTLFMNIVSTYLKDFAKEELSYTDLDDVFSLGSNKVFEYRLYRDSGGDAKILISLEKIKKQNEVLKESLATRRKDRLKDAYKAGISILDIAADFDTKRMEQKAKYERKQLRMGKKVIKEDSFEGNKKDLDAG